MWENAQLPLWIVPAGNHGSHGGMDICFDDYNCHDSPQAHLMEGINHYQSVKQKNAS